MRQAIYLTGKIGKKKEYEQKQEHEDCTCFQLPTQEGVAWSVGT
jgi:hypothetical protein